MKFPYGISDFYKIITQDYFYLDRTDCIYSIEEYGDSLLFLRPRRFGKSLLLSMLSNYYDVNKADEFERLFGHLNIGRKPTEKHNQYLIMHWDFSEVETSGSYEQIRQSLHNHLNKKIHQFATRYQHILSQEVEIDRNDALYSFGSALNAMWQTPYKMYLLIDEYDNFANAVLMSRHVRSRERYEALVKGEGVLKTIFNSVKAAASGQGLDRTFITGVSPVVMSDITSGYNIATHISLEPAFADCCGFWDLEIETILEEIGEKCGLPEESTKDALRMMRSFYDGYAFSYLPRVSAEIYNPTLALYFLRHYQRHCRPPRKMLDGNLALDQAKIAYVGSLPQGEQLITAAVAGETPIALYELEDHFGVTEMLNEEHDQDFFASLLYYLGVLTLSKIDEDGLLELKIPNLVVRKLYVEHLQNSLLPTSEQHLAKKVARTFYKNANLDPVCHFIEQHYFKVFDNRDYKSANELTLKTIFLTLLFNDTIYIMDSEMALERTYLDLSMIVRSDMRRYRYFDFLFEFKFLTLSDLKMSGKDLRKNDQELLALDKIKETLQEATIQVQAYQKRLLNRLGSALNLRTFVVVGLGFERVVWQEVPFQE